MNFIKKWENCSTKSQRQRSDMQHQLLPPGTAEEVLIVPGDTKKGLLQNLIVLQPPFSHIYKTLSAFHFALLFVFS